MNHWNITSPWVFFAVTGVVVAYVLFMMIRRRKGERAGRPERDTEL
jgi:phosphate/sulfate permease